MSNEPILTNLDQNQIVRYSFNEKLKASRVELVGSNNIHVNIDTKPLEDAIKNSLVFPKSDEKGRELQFETIKIPEIIREPSEIQKIEVPVILKETEIKVVEVPKIIEKEVIKIIEIEKPVVITEVKIIELEKEIVIERYKNLNHILVLNGIAILLLIVKMFLK